MKMSYENNENEGISKINKYEVEQIVMFVWKYERTVSTDRRAQWCRATFDAV